MWTVHLSGDKKSNFKYVKSTIAKNLVKKLQKKPLLINFAIVKIEINE